MILNEKTIGIVFMVSLLVVMFVFQMRYWLQWLRSGTKVERPEDQAEILPGGRGWILLGAIDLAFVTTWNMVEGQPWYQKVLPLSIDSGNWKLAPIDLFALFGYGLLAIGVLVVLKGTRD